MLHFSLFFLSISGIKARWLLNEAGGDPWCDCRGAQQHRSAEKSFFPEHLQSICERRGGRAIERRDHRDGEKKVGTKEKVHHGFINPERERERERERDGAWMPLTYSRVLCSHSVSAAQQQMGWSLHYELVVVRGAWCLSEVKTRGEARKQYRATASCCVGIGGKVHVRLKDCEVEQIKSLLISYTEENSSALQ